MTQFTKLINKLLNYKYIFVNEDMKNHIKNIVKKIFPKLKDKEINYINILTWYLIEDISLKFFDIDNDSISIFYNQWKQNNNQDIISVILMLLPFIDDKNNNKLHRNLTNLNHILFNSEEESNISKYYLKENRNKLLKNKFKYSNFAIGLLNKNNENLLELFVKEDESNDFDKLIYKIIFHNFNSLLET